MPTFTHRGTILRGRCPHPSFSLGKMSGKGGVPPPPGFSGVRARLAPVHHGGTSERGGGLLVNLHQLGLIFPGKNPGFRCFPRETLTFRLRTENRILTVPFLQYCILFSHICDFPDKNCDMRGQKFVVFCPRRAGFLSRKSLFTKKSVQYCRNEAG